MWVSERDSSEKAENRTEHAAERCVTGMERIGADIRKLVSYGLKTGLVPREDEIFTINRLLELFGLEEVGEGSELPEGMAYAVDLLEKERVAADLKAAQELAENGIFTGCKIGGQYFFEPDRPVSRSEFLAMVMETSGRDVTAVTMTGFCDDEAIPTWAKAYAAAGVSDGVMQGTATAEGLAFRGGDAITFNEAATVLDRVLDLGNVELDVWYADRTETPSWAAQAVGNMEAVSVLAAGSFGSLTMEQPVTRGDAARMLSAARTLLDGREGETGLFSWLK